MPVTGADYYRKCLFVFFIFLFIKETLVTAHFGHMDTLEEIVLASMILKVHFPSQHKAKIAAVLLWFNLD